ncbi:hypothetical protein HOLleu_30409 [Holothuria leucospilota]|uniref:Uncharacterized protein n=1 Tax=Holothuria leucospilota TaxID=206669 RepID=A0A9Q1GWT1_HOLLE|nr:hypothetical protein HOLleu_30409 [Holothuria leucospilota]
MNSSTDPLGIDCLLPTTDNSSPCNVYTIDSYNELPCNENFSLFHLNSRSLSKNFNSIHDFLSVLNTEFSIIGFTETWFSDNVSPHIYINNYSFVEKHRAKRGGGVCMFVKDGIIYHQRHDLSLFNASIESLFIEVEMSNAKNHIMIGIIYRPPNGSVVTFNENLNNILSKITAESKQSNG